MRNDSLRISRLLTVALAVSTAAALAPASLGAQQATLTTADSALVYDILTAEERRDAAAEALRMGAAHADPRLRLLSRRALARITDSTFAERDSLGLPSARAFPSWPLPEWAERFQALTPRGSSCDALLQAFGDSAVQVRLRAITLAGASATCPTHPTVQAALQRFVYSLPADAMARRLPQGSWHEAAAAVVSLAQLAPSAAQPMLAPLARHSMPQVRRAAARAATATRDAVLLRQLVWDQDPNVTEAALIGLSRVEGHAADSLYITRLSHSSPQIALAAATALKGSPAPAAVSAASEALRAVTARNIASERDVRSALRAILGDSTPEPWELRQRTPLPRDVIALALGEPRYIQVISSRLHGGRSFTVELRGDVAPIMAARVLARARAGRYNGQRWHRVEPGFVIQGGSRADNEYAGAEFFLVDELSRVPHPRGSVGMSTRGHDTGDAQWFVNLRDNARLMRDYTVFGVVVEGMDAVDGVLEGDEFYVMREVSAPRRPSQP